MHVLEIVIASIARSKFSGETCDIVSTKETPEDVEASRGKYDNVNGL